MIQPLRQLHRRLFPFLGVGLPILLVAGVASRQSLPNTPAKHSESSDLTQLAEQTLRLDGTPVRLGILRNREGIAFHITSGNALNAPDVLVYASTTESRETVSGDARLLGEFAADKLYRLPGDEFRFVVLYSLGHQQVLASFPLRNQS